MWQQEEVDFETSRDTENAVGLSPQKGAYSFLEQFPTSLDKFETKESFGDKTGDFFPSTSSYESSRFLSPKTNDSFGEMGSQPTYEDKASDLPTFLEANFTMTNLNDIQNSIPDDVIMNDASFSMLDQETALNNLFRDIARKLNSNTK